MAKGSPGDGLQQAKSFLTWTFGGATVVATEGFVYGLLKDR